MISNDDQLRIDICNEIKKFHNYGQLHNTPQVRVELQPSPYDRGFTKFQLDMRRKAEILKYSSNKQSGQTNSMTKKQQTALLLSGRSNGRSGLSYYQRTNINQPVNCTNDDLIPTPTSSSDIPGPRIDLIYDESVPLYNYRINRNMNN